jgi:hypothetical protein
LLLLFFLILLIFLALFILFLLVGLLAIFVLIVIVTIVVTFAVIVLVFRCLVFRRFSLRFRRFYFVLTRGIASCGFDRRFDFFGRIIAFALIFATICGRRFNRLLYFLARVASLLCGARGRYIRFGSARRVFESLRQRRLFLLSDLQADNLWLRRPGRKNIPRHSGRWRRDVDGDKQCARGNNRFGNISTGHEALYWVSFF